MTRDLKSGGVIPMKPGVVVLDHPETRTQRECLEILDEARALVEAEGAKAMMVLVVRPDDAIFTKHVSGNLREIVGAHQIAIHDLIARCDVTED